MIEEAVAAVLNGDVVGLPTDTVYGIGADPFNAEAVSRLFDLKGRPAGKPVGILVGTLSQARAIGDIAGRALALAEAYWPGGLTLVVIPKVVMADWVGHSQLRTIGIRVPDHPIARQLLERTGPLAVTSANESGGAEAMNDREARDVFGNDVSVYLEGTAPGGEPSTVVDATGNEFVIIRQGPVAI